MSFLFTQVERKGTALMVDLARKIIGEDEVFIVLGDTICEYGISAVLHPDAKRTIRRNRRSEIDDKGFINKVIEKTFTPTNMHLCRSFFIKSKIRRYSFKCLDKIITNNTSALNEP